PGSPGRRTRSARGAVGWRWIGSALTSRTSVTTPVAARRSLFVPDRTSAGRLRRHARRLGGCVGPTMSEFTSEAEFREVIDRAFALMSDDPEMEPKLRDADTPQR